MRKPPNDVEDKSLKVIQVKTTEEMLRRMEALEIGKREKFKKLEESKSADNNKLPSTGEEDFKAVEEISNEAKPISRFTFMFLFFVNHH